MKTLSIRTTVKDAAARPGNQQNMTLQTTHSRRDCRIYPALPAAPGRLLCRTKRAMLAAFRAAEYDLWQATGGDYLAGTHQPVSS